MIAKPFKIKETRFNAQYKNSNNNVQTYLKMNVDRFQTSIENIFKWLLSLFYYSPFHLNIFIYAVVLVTIWGMWPKMIINIIYHMANVMWWPKWLPLMTLWWSMGQPKYNPDDPDGKWWLPVTIIATNCWWPRKLHVKIWWYLTTPAGNFIAKVESCLSCWLVAEIHHYSIKTCTRWDEMWCSCMYLLHN